MLIPTMYWRIGHQADPAGSTEPFIIATLCQRSDVLNQRGQDVVAAASVLLSCHRWPAILICHLRLHWPTSNCTSLTLNIIPSEI